MSWGHKETTGLRWTIWVDSWDCADAICRDAWWIGGFQPPGTKRKGNSSEGGNSIQHKSEG